VDLLSDYCYIRILR